LTNKTVFIASIVTISALLLCYLMQVNWFDFYQVLPIDSTRDRFDQDDDIGLKSIVKMFEKSYLQISKS